MRRIPLLLMSLLLLVACGPAGTPASPPMSEATTAVPPQEGNNQPASQVAVFTPATTPEEAGIVRPQDWVKGASDPVVTIIEYGDFQ